MSEMHEIKIVRVLESNNCVEVRAELRVPNVVPGPGWIIKEELVNRPGLFERLRGITWAAKIQVAEARLRMKVGEALEEWQRARLESGVGN